MKYKLNVPGRKEDWKKNPKHALVYPDQVFIEIFLLKWVPVHLRNKKSNSL